MMHAVYGLFEGTAKPEDVLKASGTTGALQMKTFDSQTYHGWLYVGLYHEMAGDQEASIAAMEKAQRCGLPGPGIMSLVASTHLKLRSGTATENESGE